MKSKFTLFTLLMQIPIMNFQSVLQNKLLVFAICNNMQHFPLLFIV